VEQGVLEHAAVAGREDEAVAVERVRVLGVVAHDFSSSSPVAALFPSTVSAAAAARTTRWRRETAADDGARRRAGSGERSWPRLTTDELRRRKPRRSPGADPPAPGAGPARADMVACAAATEYAAMV